MPLDRNGRLQIIADPAGIYEFVARAADAAGNVGTNSFTLTVFDVVNDPNETTDLASKYPDIVKNMTTRLQTLRTGFYQNNETGVDSCPPNITIPCVCWVAENVYGDFLGPWQYINITQIQQEQALRRKQEEETMMISAVI